MAFFERGLNLASPDTAKDLMAQRGQRQEGRLANWQNMWGQFGQTMAAKGEAKRQREHETGLAADQRTHEIELNTLEIGAEKDLWTQRLKSEKKLSDDQIQAAKDALNKQLTSDEKMTMVSLKNTMSIIEKQITSGEGMLDTRLAHESEEARKEREWRENVGFPQEREIAEIRARIDSDDPEERLEAEMWEHINSAAQGLNIRDTVTGQVMHSKLAADPELANRFREAFLISIEGDENAGKIQRLFNTFYSTYWEGAGAGEGGEIPTISEALGIDESTPSPIQYSSEDIRRNVENLNKRQERISPIEAQLYNDLMILSTDPAASSRGTEVMEALADLREIGTADNLAFYKQLIEQLSNPTEFDEEGMPIGWTP